MIQSTFANAGIPMIVLALPSMVVLLAPVILLEVFASRKLITKERPAHLWTGVTLANIVSTFIGWPIAWALLVLLQMFTGGGAAHGLDSPIGILLSVTQQAPWLIPYESDLDWMIPVAMGVLLIPFFFVSVYVERLALRVLWKTEDPINIKFFSWKAHLYSYGFLYLILAGGSIYSNIG